MSKTIIVASFVQVDKKEEFFAALFSKTGLSKEKVFAYKDLDDENRHILTFKLEVNDGERINVPYIVPNSTIVHKKGNAYYTINALNRLIDLECNIDKGNLSYETYNVDWSRYQGYLIITNKDVLQFIKIERIV